MNSNLIVGAPAGGPAGDSFPASVADIGFVNAANLSADYHNYALSSSSGYKGKGTDGRDPGFAPSGYDAAASPAPTADSVTGIAAGSNQILTMQYSSPGGYAFLTDVFAVINRNLSGSGGCLVLYDRPSNGLFLAADSGTNLAGPVTPGGTGSLKNSQCTLNAASSLVTGSGPSLTMVLNLVLSGPFISSPNTIYLFAEDGAGQNSGWQNRGSFGTYQAGPPTADSAGPISSGSSPQNLVFRYSSPNGYGYLSGVYALIGSSVSGTAACFILYDRANDALYLANDAGSGILGPLTPGANGVLKNGQCAVSGVGSSVAGSGNTLTMTLNTTFTGSFGAGKSVYLDAVDASGLTSGWQSRGALISP